MTSTDPPRRVLITGAQGFLGRYLTAALLQREPRVEILGVGRSPQLAGTFTHPSCWNGRQLPAPLPRRLREVLASERYRYAVADVGSSGRLAALLGEFRPHVVVHLASARREARARSQYRAHAEGSLALGMAIDASLDPPPRWIVMSSAGVYGEVAAEHLPIREELPCRPADLFSASKLAAEQAAAVVSSRAGIPLVVVRGFNLVGSGQSEDYLAARLARQAATIRRRGEAARMKMGTLDTTRDFLDVRDAARALVLLLERGEPGTTYNLGSGREVSVRSVLESVLEVADLEGPVIFRHDPAREVDARRHVAAVDRLRGLGFEERHSLEGSIEDALDYYLSEVDGSARRPAGERIAVESTQSRCHRSLSTTLERAYDVTIVEGLLSRDQRTLVDLLAGRDALLVTTPTVAERYAHRLREQLAGHGLEVPLEILDCREETKTLDRVERLCRVAKGYGIGRQGVLVGLGGGVCTDIVTVAASWLRRGIGHIRLPTTLLGQIDAAIGIKGAVNFSGKKNYLGCFYPPQAVLVDPSFLLTLDRTHLSAGFAEIIKIAAVCDRELFDLVEAHAGHLLDTAFAEPRREGREILWRAAARLLDELAPNVYEDRSYRRLADFGHVFSPLLEVASGFSISHGQAVGIDIALTSLIAVELGWLDDESCDRILATLARAGCPTHSELLTAELCAEAMAEATRHRGGCLNMVVPVAIGAARFVTRCEELPSGVCRAALARLSDRAYRASSRR